MRCRIWCQPQKQNWTQIVFSCSVLLLFPFFSNSLCVPLGNKNGQSNWTELIKAINENKNFLVICAPFNIKNSRCGKRGGKGYEVVNEVVEIACEQSVQRSGDHGCVIDCRGRHFTVLNGGSLTLDGIKLKNSHNSSVYVEGANFVSKECEFERNRKFVNRRIEGGGAIYADEASSIEISNSNFIRNRGVYGGGAIHYKGEASIKESLFIENFAAGPGGAIYNEQTKKGKPAVTQLVQNEFIGNNSTLSGGAFFTRMSSIDFNSARCDEKNIGCNTGCNNNAIVNCGGIYKNGNCLQLAPMPSCKRI